VALAPDPAFAYENRMGPTEFGLIFGGVVSFGIGLLHQLVEPTEKGHHGRIWFLAMWGIRPWWCFALGAVLLVSAFVRPLVR